MVQSNTRTYINNTWLWCCMRILESNFAVPPRPYHDQCHACLMSMAVTKHAIVGTSRGMKSSDIAACEVSMQEPVQATAVMQRALT